MIYLLSSVLLNAFAQISLKLAADRPFEIRSLMANKPLYFAAIFYLLSIAFWLKGLSNTPLSQAYPLQSLGYVVVFSLSYFILNEPIKGIQFLGLLIICTGIFILGVTQ